MQYTEIFKVLKIEIFNRFFPIFSYYSAQNRDCGYTVITSTHNLCFGAKIRKISIPLQTPVFICIKAGFKRVYFSWTCFPDDAFLCGWVYMENMPM